MEGSATKHLELNHSDAAQIRKSSSSRIVSRIYVEGYDTSLSGYDFVKSMREHLASCGEVMHVYIPGYAEGRRGILNRFALIYLRGKGAEDKALKLSGSYSRGHKLVVEPYPFHANHLDHKLEPMRDADNKEVHVILVDGYDTRLPLDYVKSMLFKQFSHCGRVLYISLYEKGGFVSRYAYVAVEGIDTIERLLQLSGCHLEEWKNLNFSRVAPPRKDGAGNCNTPPFWSLACSTSRISVMAATPEETNLPKPPSMATRLPSPWNYRVDSGTGNVCVWNSETGVEHEIPPSSAPASTILYAPKDPNLPKPWKGLVDSSTGYGYFWNTETNVTQYHRPHSSLAAPGYST